MTQYNLATIRELLAAAFSSSEIDTLAFDLFQEVYRNFTSGMINSAKISLIVTHASDHGQIPRLLTYVENHNPYQYQRFAAQLKAEAESGPKQKKTQKPWVYDVTKQPWHMARFPQTKDMNSEQAMRLANEVDVVLITATEVELKAVIRLLEPLSGQEQILLTYIGPETYFLGRFGAYTAVVTRCRMGAIGEGSVILATEQAQRIWRPRAIIMVGIAFGKNSAKQQMGDVLVASQIISYEQQRVGAEIVFRGPITPINTTLLNRFENAYGWHFDRPDGKPAQLHFGPILSGEKLVDDDEFKQELFRQFPQAIGGEMEGAGLAAASGRVGVAWILVKGICDWADGTKEGTHQPLAAAAATSLVHYVLSQNLVLQAIPKIPAPQQNDSAPASPSVSLSNSQQERLKVVEKHIQTRSTLLSQYEDQLAKETDPRRLAAIQDNIDRERTAIAEYEREKASLLK